MNDDREEVVEEATGEAPELATQVEAPASLSIQDLANLKHIIDVVSQRGAFQAGEMTVVGTTYNRLVAFLQAVTAQQPAADDGAAETEEEAAEA